MVMMPLFVALLVPVFVAVVVQRATFMRMPLGGVGLAVRARVFAEHQ
jgi:hypothetical protein